jgi:hypothetical protein
MIESTPIEVCLHEKLGEMRECGSGIDADPAEALDAAEQRIRELEAELALVTEVMHHQAERAAPKEAGE